VDILKCCSNIKCILGTHEVRRRYNEGDSRKVPSPLETQLLNSPLFRSVLFDPHLSDYMRFLSGNGEAAAPSSMVASLTYCSYALAYVLFLEVYEVISVRKFDVKRITFSHVNCSFSCTKYCILGSLLDDSLYPVGLCGS
jgi:hypothetical protein